MKNKMTGFYRKPDLRRITGLSDSTLERLERDGLFPKRKKLSARNVGWLCESVNDWISSREEVNL